MSRACMQNLAHRGRKIVQTLAFFRANRNIEPVCSGLKGAILACVPHLRPHLSRKIPLKLLDCLAHPSAGRFNCRTRCQPMPLDLVEETPIADVEVLGRVAPVPA